MTLFLWEGGIARPRLQRFFMPSTSFNGGGGETIDFLCWVILLRALSEHTLSASSQQKSFFFLLVPCCFTYANKGFHKIPQNTPPPPCFSKILKIAPPSSCPKIFGLGSNGRGSVRFQGKETKLNRN